MTNVCRVDLEEGLLGSRRRFWQDSLIPLKTTNKQTKRTAKVNLTEICAQNMKKKEDFF